MNNNNENSKTLEEKISYISNETTLLQFIKDNNIAEIDQIHNIQKYHIGDDRIGTIIEVQEKNKDIKTKILIDLKLGQPTINQIYDSLYNIGKECSIKIIMFTGGHNDNDLMVPTADEFVVNGLIDQLQQSNVEILLCSIFGDTIKVEDHSIYDYWKQVDRAGKIDPPTEEELMLQTFWAVYFDSFNTGFYEPWNAYDVFSRSIKDWGFIIYLDDFIYGEIQLHWDENGARYEITIDDMQDDFINTNLSYELLHITDRYGIDPVDYESGKGRPTKLTIQYSDKPFSWLYTADPKEITDFAKSMHEDAWGLRWQIEETAMPPKRGPRWG